MRALVVGGSGFIGRATCRMLAGAGNDVIDVSRRAEADPVAGVRAVSMTLPAPQLGRLVAELRPDVVVYAAGSPTLGAAARDPSGDFGVGVVALQQILDAVRVEGLATRLVLLSSAAVYGEGLGRRLDEEASCAPMAYYGHTRLMAEQLVKAHVQQFGLDAVMLRLFSVFGPGQTKQVIHDLARRLLARPAVMDIMATGRETRDFVHLHDVAASIVRLSAADGPQGICNIGTGRATSLAEIAAGLAARISPETALTFMTETAPGNPVSLVADATKAGSWGLDLPSRLDEGLDRICDALKKNEVRHS